MAPSNPTWTPSPKTAILLTLSRKKGQGRCESIKKFRGLILAQVRAKKYLDRVENATRKTVFSEICFVVRVSFCPKFLMNLNMMFTSYVP